MRRGRDRVKLKGLPTILAALGMTQNELAKRSGLTQAAISHFVSGSREPALSSILAILEVLPTTFEKLIGDEK